MKARTIKIYRYITRAVCLVVVAAFLLVDVYSVVVDGLRPWNIAVLVFLIVWMLLMWALCRIMERQIVWIEIGDGVTELINLKGDVISIATADIVRIVYGLMLYQIVILQTGEERVIRCSSGVKVSKNGRRHRGIWIEDFPFARFEDR